MKCQEVTYVESNENYDLSLKVYYEMSLNRMIIITWVKDLHVIIVNRQNMRRLSHFDCGGLVQCDRWCVERNIKIKFSVFLDFWEVQRNTLDHPRFEGFSKI